MKLHILYRFQTGPWGGGNQFLHALREELRRQGRYAERLDGADALLVNMNPGSLLHIAGLLLRLRLWYPRLSVLARVDGPISLIRGRQKYIDCAIAFLTRCLADGIIWQSTWARDENKKLTKLVKHYETVIHNTPDNHVFFPPDSHLLHSPIRLIATSWSANWRKGFGIYQYLDSHLNWSRYQMTFVGNSPISFKNIKTVSPLASPALAVLLRQQDIYITASQNDPCSNALLEALACGLPVVALASGGHPELLDGGGKLFTGKQDIIEAIDEVTRDYENYHIHLPLASIANVAEQYYYFADKLVRLK